MALLDGIGDKRPKVPPACFNCIEEASRAFGAVHLPLKVSLIFQSSLFHDVSTQMISSISFQMR